ncbi:hypothetical protein [Asticcacaulis solisilvae]|uniref:hypothetical protein n=1 Tax=Asticcacaulis solisilvae TaxID=1217274 RepID=UPI003FD85404
MPTVFGSLLTIAFGIWFPQIMLQDVTSAFDVAQKLAAPVLGLGLVGIGVAQQADTAKMQTDIELVEKGLPPSIHLSDNQRAYILTKNNISAESATYIQNQMDYVHDQLQEISSTQSSMSTTLNQKPGYQGEEIQAFQARIANLQNQLDSAKIQINQISNQNRVSEAQMEATGRYLSQINTTLTTGNTARQAYECTLLQLELQKVDPLQPIVIRDVHESLAKLDAHERENILQRAGHFITGYNAIANASGPGQEAEAERIKTSLKKAYDENCLADAKTSVAVSAVDSGH